MYARPLFVLGVTILALLVLVEGMATPPEEKWPTVMEREARKIPLVNAATGERDSAAMRAAAQARWNLADYRFARDERETASKEYKELIKEFPYVPLDHGYRTDDARKRLERIRQLNTSFETAQYLPDNAYSSQDDAATWESWRDYLKRRQK